MDVCKRNEQGSGARSLVAKEPIFQCGLPGLPESPGLMIWFEQDSFINPGNLGNPGNPHCFTKINFRSLSNLLLSPNQELASWQEWLKYPLLFSLSGDRWPHL